MGTLATVSAILGLLCYGPILGPDYLVQGAEHKNQVILGAIMELILVVTAIGTAIGLFPILRRYGERIALAHLSFRFLEGVVISVGVVGSTLALLAGILAMFDIAAPFTPLSGLLSAPIAVFEMLLARWLIARGFRAPATSVEPARTVTNTVMAAAH